MKSKVIVVTGALGALGKVVAETALARGAKVAGIDHAPSQLPATSVRLELGGVHDGAHVMHAMLECADTELALGQTQTACRTRQAA